MTQLRIIHQGFFPTILLLRLQLFFHFWAIPHFFTTFISASKNFTELYAFDLHGL